MNRHDRGWPVHINRQTILLFLLLCAANFCLACPTGLPAPANSGDAGEIPFEGGATKDLLNCGNDQIDPDELCDGTQLGDKTCLSFGFISGELKCNSNCLEYDTSGCSKCGDEFVQPPEECDGPNLDNQTCVQLGFDSGELSCLPDCQFSKAKCIFSTCGDNIVNGKENCDGSALANKDCPSLGFVGGTLKCAANCLFDTSDCYKCGDKKINTGEQCDTTELGGKTCKTQGFAGGTLSCSSKCQFDTSKCCNPSCSGKLCGAADGCVGTCQAGSGCCTPSCNASCGASDGCGGTCYGENADSCSGVAAETWRCVHSNHWGTKISQVCRSGGWVTYVLDPRACATCCNSYSISCCPSSGCP